MKFAEVMKLSVAGVEIVGLGCRHPLERGSFGGFDFELQCT